MAEGAGALRSNPVEYTVDDLVALSKLVPRSATYTFRLVLGAVLILLVFSITVQVWALAGFVDWGAIILTCVVVVLFAVLSNRRVRATFWLRLAKRSPLHGPHSFTITPNSLRINSPSTNSEVRWTAFRNVRRAGDRLFLFMSPRQAFIVPERAFDGDDQFEAFAAAAEERWRAETGI